MQGQVLKLATEASTYAITGGDEGRERLERMAKLRSDATRRLLESAGVPAGARCLDLGCGTGHGTRLLAEMVGPAGSVVGVDVDAPMIEANRRDAPPNAEFRVADLRAIQEGGFDLAYLGLVLMHLPKPDDVIASVVRSLRPGGVLVSEDGDSLASHCEPPSPAFDRMIEMFERLLAGRTGDARSVLSLPTAFRRAGLVEVKLSLYQLVATASDLKEILPLTLALSSEAIASDGIASADEIDEVVAQLYELSEDPAVSFAMPRIHQIFGRVPASSLGEKDE